MDGKMNKWMNGWMFLGWKVFGWLRLGQVWRGSSTRTVFTTIRFVPSNLLVSRLDHSLSTEFHPDFDDFTSSSV